MAMETQSERDPKSNPTEVETHIKSAHQILKELQKKIGEHPEIGAAITKLEMALNDLAIQTGGLL
jgi:predicted translin family RNA/ssDNA-binding protein